MTLKPLAAYRGRCFTPDTTVPTKMAPPPKLYQFLVATVASLGSLLGYDPGVIAAVIASPGFDTHFSSPTAAQTGVVVSLFTAGPFVGAFLGSPSADWFGRRTTMIVGSLVFCLGGALQTAGVDINYMYTGRLFAG